MIKFLVCDDEKIFLDKINNVITKTMIDFKGEYTIESYQEYNKEFYKRITEKGPKIYILDIELKNGKSGIDIARKIRINDWESLIIMVTSHSELGFEAVKAQIMLLDFISKYNNCENSLSHAIRKAVSKLNDKKVFTFEINNVTNRVFISDIIYIVKEPSDKKCTIKTTYNEIVINMPLNQIFEQLKGKLYFSHRSCLVNIDRIIKVDWKENIITFDTGATIDLISRDKKKRLKEYVNVV